MEGNNDSVNVNVSGLTNIESDDNVFIRFTDENGDVRVIQVIESEIIEETISEEQHAEESEETVTEEQHAEESEEYGNFPYSSGGFFENIRFAFNQRMLVCNPFAH